MQRLSADAYQGLVYNATQLEADGHGPKVLRLADGSFLKMFRRKRLISSEALRPYAERFAENARALHEADIPAPKVIALYRIETPKRTAVHYIGLPGITLRQAMKEAETDEREWLVERFGQLLAHLHEIGIYFRSLHLGNVMLLPDRRLGLIDFADMHRGRAPMPMYKRRRNLKHMQRYEQEQAWLFTDYRAALARGYRQLAPLRVDGLL